MDKLLFVYGTLKRKGRLNHHLVAAKAEFLGEGRAYGQLFDIGGLFPVLVRPADTDMVKTGIFGEVWRMHDPQVTLEQLDYLEGVAGGLYERQQIPVSWRDDTTRQLQITQAWTYLPHGDWWQQGARFCESGRWPEVKLLIQ